MTLKSYGYPWYFQNHNQTLLLPGVVLQNINGYPVPIRLGTLDFFMQGSLKDIEKFLHQHEKSFVVAQHLVQDTGRWEDGGGRVYVTISQKTKTENEKVLLVQHFAKSIGSIFMKSNYASELIDYVGSFVRGTDIFTTVYDKFEQFKSLSDNVYGPSESEKDIKDASDFAKEKKHAIKTIAKRVAKIFKDKERIRDFVPGIDKILPIDNREELGGKYLNEHKDIIVQLTSTPPPYSVIKTVFSMGSYKVTCGQIATNINNFFENKPIQEFAPLASYTGDDGDIF